MKKASLWIILFFGAALLVTPFTRAQEQKPPQSLPAKKGGATTPKSKPTAKKPKVTPAAKVQAAVPTVAPPNAKEPPKTLAKFPKAIFLIKRAKIDSDIGEPVMYPFERQLKNVYYDIPGGQLRND